MRKRAVPVLVLSLALLVASGGTGLAKPRKPPFKTGVYTGTVTSNISGKEPASRFVRVEISKVGRRYRLETTFNARITCNGRLRSRSLVFGVIYVSKKTGHFSGKTVRGRSPGTATVSGDAKGKKLTATWNYGVPDGSCWGNGNVDATRR
jgi:hypothetical protein